jgi:hypothetical protein
MERNVSAISRAVRDYRQGSGRSDRARDHGCAFARPAFRAHADGAAPLIRHRRDTSAAVLPLAATTFRPAVASHEREHAATRARPSTQSFSVRDCSQPAPTISTAPLPVTRIGRAVDGVERITCRGGDGVLTPRKPFATAVAPHIFLRRAFDCAIAIRVTPLRGTCVVSERRCPRRCIDGSSRGASRQRSSTSRARIPCIYEGESVCTNGEVPRVCRFVSTRRYRS